MPREKGCPGSLEKWQQCWCGAVEGSDKALWHRGLPQPPGDVSGAIPSHRALCRALLQHSPGSSCRPSAGTTFTPGKREGCVGAGKQSSLFPLHPPVDRTVLQSQTKGGTMPQALHDYNSSTMGDHTLSQSSIKTPLDYISGYENSGC